MLKVGDTLPAFSLLDQHGEMVDSQSFLGTATVIYFYPKDDTPGCTAQACSFRDHFEDFKKLDAEVVGISSDGLEAHKKFAAKHKLPFILLSDEKKVVRKLFGVPRSFLGMIPGRVTYVFDPQGKLLHIFNSQLKATKHIEEALNALKTP